VTQGKLIVISSPSGGGKSTVIQALREKDSTRNYSISATTRLPRDGEQDGHDYHFITKEAFQKKIEKDAFLEWAIVHGHHYGTLREDIERDLISGKKILLDIDVQGGLKVKELLPESVLIFLLPPSLKILEQRLRDRGTEIDDVLEKRLEIAQREIEEADQYDYQVINKNLNETINAIEAIIQKTRTN